MNQAIATGKLVSFALISFFSIFREGAETIIFYSGMAPYMSIEPMMIGIVIATAILLVGKHRDGSRVSLLPNYDFGCLRIRSRIINSQRRI